MALEVMPFCGVIRDEADTSWSAQRGLLEWQQGEGWIGVTTPRAGSCPWLIFSRTKGVECPVLAESAELAVCFRCACWLEADWVRHPGVYETRLKSRCPQAFPRRMDRTRGTPKAGGRHDQASRSVRGR